MKARVLISGGSGLIGTSLIRALDANSIHVSQLIRQMRGNRVPDSARHILWNPYGDPPVADPRALEGLDAVVHLSGANVAGHRWTETYRQEIVRSRIGTTEALAGVFGRLERPPRTFLCASAIGIYGDRGDQMMAEDSAPGEGFLAEVCSRWEAAARKAEAAGVRVVSARFGVVLAREGGALAKMLPLFRIGLGGRLGSGRQWMSWISLRDTVRSLLFAMECEDLRGPVNVVAPNPVRNAEFTRRLGRQLGRPALATAPAFALRLAMGQMADEALLASTRAVPARLLGAGFTFQDVELADALRDLLGR